VLLSFNEQSAERDNWIELADRQNAGSFLNEETMLCYFHLEYLP
jgi:hypothetical protein